MPRLTIVSLALLLAGCTAAAVAPSAGAPLATSLQAEPRSDTVRFVLQVTNVKDRPVVLDFTSGQEYDFAVLQEGREVWRWSAGRMFTQALRADTLAPGETRTYRAGWVPGDARGDLTVRGELRSGSHPVAEEIGFRVP